MSNKDGKIRKVEDFESMAQWLDVAPRRKARAIRGKEMVRRIVAGFVSLATKAVEEEKLKMAA